jgi:hypothetical protein
MAKYSFSITNVDIASPRSPLQDTDYVVAALSVNGNIVSVPQTKFIRNQGKGKLSIGLGWRDVEVPETEDANVTLWYHIVNRDGEHDVAFEQTLVDLANKSVAQPTTTKSDDAGKSDAVGAVVFVGEVIDKVNKFFKGRCDGPITPKDGRKIVWHNFELKAIASGSKAEDNIVEPGSDSPAGCGDNSHYTVNFSVEAA